MVRSSAYHSGNRAWTSAGKGRLQCPLFSIGNRLSSHPVPTSSHPIVSRPVVSAYMFTMAASSHPTSVQHRLILHRANEMETLATIRIDVLLNQRTEVVNLPGNTLLAHVLPCQRHNNACIVVCSRILLKTKLLSSLHGTIRKLLKRRTLRCCDVNCTILHKNLTLHSTLWTASYVVSRISD
ncbi:hypothetical protein K491DRAFT_523666 [Lophiostoma macrostomum CBS 122681]|uniref:Uncharacterized protein n=1 Tax=Lophiostoma macrostomum CBS 122681 TaxID=1314788 RepID=A0A6A6T1L0_9PLEO|nr:hypothetical protein K491DRAFT_523666 [Lophiostoma macrostomum CBS 122681]